MNVTANPGDYCRMISRDGKVVAVEHVAPCRDRHATGTVTDIRTGKVLGALEAARLMAVTR